MSKLKIGLIQLFYGNGRGKTTAAMGTATRAAGHGLKVAVFQFLKGGDFTGEAAALKKLGVEFYQLGPSGTVVGKSDRWSDRQDNRVCVTAIVPGLVQSRRLHVQALAAAADGSRGRATDAFAGGS